jgi:hypothetical protein
MLTADQVTLEILENRFKGDPEVLRKLAKRKGVDYLVVIANLKNRPGHDYEKHVVAFGPGCHFKDLATAAALTMGKGVRRRVEFFVDVRSRQRVTEMLKEIDEGE